MKELLFLILMLSGFYLKVLSQDIPEKKNNYKNIDTLTTDKNAFSIQALKHVVGIDYERIIYKKIGMALSAGLSGVELEAKIHFVPKVESSSICFSSGYVWYTDNAAWKTSRVNMFFFEYRAKKRLTFTVGAGWFDFQNNTRVRLRGGVGIYFPW